MLLPDWPSSPTRSAQQDGSQHLGAREVTAAAGEVAVRAATQGLLTAEARPPMPPPPQLTHAREQQHSALVMAALTSVAPRSLIAEGSSRGSLHLGRSSVQSTEPRSLSLSDDLCEELMGPAASSEFDDALLELLDTGPGFRSPSWLMAGAGLSSSLHS